jgi:hypothetical protein
MLLRHKHTSIGCEFIAKNNYFGRVLFPRPSPDGFPVLPGQLPPLPPSFPPPPFLPPPPLPITLTFFQWNKSCPKSFQKWFIED